MSWKALLFWLSLLQVLYTFAQHLLWPHWRVTKHLNNDFWDVSALFYVHFACLRHICQWLSMIPMFSKQPLASYILHTDSTTRASLEQTSSSDCKTLRSMRQCRACIMHESLQRLQLQCVLCSRAGCCMVVQLLSRAALHGAFGQSLL